MLEMYVAKIKTIKKSSRHPNNKGFFKPYGHDDKKVSEII